MSIPLRARQTTFRKRNVSDGDHNFQTVNTTANIMRSLVILASGSGTNADNIARFFAEGSTVEVKALLTDRENAPVREKMEKLGIPVVYFPRKEWREDPAGIASFITDNYHPDLVILAGFNSILREEFVNAFEGKILNIHPSLLPAYGGPGMWGHNVHEAVLQAGEKESGVTVHIVTNEVDGGPIVMQERVPVLEGDTPETLEARIHATEYTLYPRAIIEMLRRTKQTVPPPIPPDQQWAEALGIPHTPEDFTPRQTPPPVPQSAPLAEAEETPMSDPRTASQTGAHPAMQHSQGQPSPAYYQPGHPASPQQIVSGQPVMPPTYMVWAILSLIFCCFPTGIVAVIMAAQVSSRFYQKDYEGAKRASRNTEIWIIITFVLGVLINTLYLPFTLLLEAI